VEELNNGNIIELNKHNWKEILESDKIVLVDFYAEWCPPCLKIEPILEEIAKEYENIKVCRFNVDESREIAEEYYIHILPTLAIFRNGEIVSGIEGLANKNTIKRMIEIIISENCI
jgi:thioredoxin 1